MRGGTRRDGQLSDCQLPTQHDRDEQQARPKVLHLRPHRGHSNDPGRKHDRAHLWRCSFEFDWSLSNAMLHVSSVLILN